MTMEQFLVNIYEVKQDINKYLLKNIFYKSLMFTEKNVFNCQVIFS